jgi:hypothetical protein
LPHKFSYDQHEENNFDTQHANSSQNKASICQTDTLPHTSNNLHTKLSSQFEDTTDSGKHPSDSPNTGGPLASFPSPPTRKQGKEGKREEGKRERGKSEERRERERAKREKRGEKKKTMEREKREKRRRKEKQRGV